MIDRRFPIALVCTLLLAASVPGLAMAQEDEPEPVIYGVYLQCEPAQAARASELIRESWGPIVQAHVDAGNIASWGALTHHTGGSWSRAVYLVGMDRSQLFQTLDETGAEWMEADPDGATEFWEICDEHEDYVWSYVDGSAPAEEIVQDRPTAGMSVYWVCDQNQQAVADLIVENVMAKAWNAQVEAGLINNWGWYAHVLGDKYRRLLAVDGASHNALLEARENVIGWVGENEPALGSAFSNACNEHVDYLWNIESSEM
jgi:hypothetical protein